MELASRSACALGLLLGLSSCAVTVNGLVERQGNAVMLRTPEGAELPLLLGPEQTGLQWVQGADVMIEGSRVFGQLSVREWTTGDGRNGWPTWLGTLESKGVQLGLQDRNSGAFYLLDKTMRDPLGESVGKLVLIEGYVSGAHRVTVLDAQVLDGSTSP